MDENLPYILAFSSTTLFALSCMFYAVFADKISSIWMNTFKTVIACFGFFIVTSVFYTWHGLSLNSFLCFFISGFAGLGIGDLFLMLAFTRIGAARTLMVFGFSPLFNGIQGYLFFNQVVSFDKLIAIVCLIICLFIFSYEGYKKAGQWEVKGVLFALIGVSLDAIGVGITRYGFEDSLVVDPIEANFYRAIGALCFFVIYNYFQPINLLSKFRPLSPKEKCMAVGASLSGTFLALWCWNTAIKWGHLASLSAIGATGPFLATLFECIYYKRWPNKYMIASTFFFVIGLYILFL